MIRKKVDQKAKPKFDLSGLLDTMKSTEKGVKVIDRNYEEEFVPTGSIVLDEVLGLKGVPFGGRVLEIHGKEHGGKSTILYNIIKSYQEYTGMPAIIFDFEDTTRHWYLDGIGVNTDAEMLRIEVCGSIDDCIKRAIAFMEGGVKLFMFDSIPRMKGLNAIKDIKSGQAMKASVGAHARAMTQFFDMLLPYASKYDCLFLMVNQMRARIDGSMEAAQAVKYPSVINLPYVLPGGNSVRYNPSIMIEVSPVKAYRGAPADNVFLMEPEEESDTSKDFKATKVKVRILKNKATSAGYREYYLYLRPGKGIDEWMSVRDLAKIYDLIRNEKKKWLVGKDSNILAIYDNKEQLIKDLVIDQNLEVLTRLREQLVEVIRQDDSGKFVYNPDKAVKYISGETDDVDVEESVVDDSAFLVDDDDL